MQQVSSGLIEDGAVTSTKIAAGAVGSTQLATGAVGSTQIADASITPTDLAQPLTRGTAVSTTTGTSVDFTGIPSWVKKITVMLSGVSTNSSGGLLIQLGSTTIETTGYTSQVNAFNNAPGGVTVTNGFQVSGGSASTYFWNGIVHIVNLNGNVWVTSGSAATTVAASTAVFAGSKTLAGVLDRIRLTTTTTDTFDAGSVNIFYE